MRDLHGIVLLDKPKGLSSNAAMQKVKRLFQARKAGHGGSLDPLATGLLPVCFGRATRVAAFLLDAAKGYETVCELGSTTTTGDKEGEVTSQKPVPELSDAAIEQALATLTGPIDQIPPMYSALKHQGKRLYQLARSGVEVERPPRRVTIFEFKLLRRQGPLLTLGVRCSKGTYIRTLVEDLGSLLGCGAHVAKLRRTAVTPFAIDKMCSLQQLEQARDAGEDQLLQYLEPADSALLEMPYLDIDRATAQRLCHGQRACVGSEQPEGALRRLYGPEGQFIGIGVVESGGQLKIHRLLGNPEEIRGLGKPRSA